MGVKTAAEIIKEGVELAGVAYDATDNNPLSWLKQWLESVALGWPWPEVSGGVVIELLAGEYTQELGMGSLFRNTLHIHRLLFPIQAVYPGDFLPDPIYQEGFIEARIDINSIPIGVPDRASYLRSTNTPGQVTLYFNRRAKKDLNIEVKYQYNPAVNYTTADIPWYQNDETMIHAVAYKAAKYADGPDASTTAAFANDLSTMVRNDKLKFGVVDSFVMKMNRNPRSR
jgi:hypothetical protein